MSKLEVKGLSKTFGDVKALKDVNLTLEGDKIIGLLGRNGAGKSTLLNIISNRIFPTTGSVSINGEPAKESDRAQGQVYLMSEKSFYPDGMTVKRALEWTGAMYGSLDMAYAEKLCADFGLNWKKKIKQLSTGYTSIFKIVTALSLDVPILLLDEPILGLDANHRDLFYKLLIENYSNNPRTIILSTHLIEEVSALVEEVVIIKSGTIIRHEPSEKLLAGGYTVSGPSSMVDSFVQGRQVIGSDALGGLKTAYIMGEQPDGVLPAGLEVGRMDLQKLFIQLTNQ